MPKYNKNGQIIPETEDVSFGVSNPQQTVSSAGVALKNINKAEKEAAKKQELKDRDDYYQDVYGMSTNEYFSKVQDAGIGIEPPQPLKKYVSFDDWKKQKTLPEGSSSGTNTIPLNKEVQNEIDTSNDAVRQEKAQLKQTADEVREDTRKNNLIDIAEEGRKKYDLFSSNVDSHYIDGLPRSIWNAWKNGKFGTPDSKDAKSVRNTLLMNEIGTMLSNMGSAIGRNGEMKEGLWSSSVRRNMEEADKRNNDKFETNMKNQLAQLDLSAKEQLEMEKHINELMADNTFAVAAKHANNIEDTIGLWHLKQALGKEWNNMSSKDKMGFLNAVNAIQNGDTTSGKAMLQSVLGDEGMAKLQKQMSDYQMKQSKANADMAETDANFRGVQNTMGVVNNVAGAIGSVVGLAK